MLEPTFPINNKIKINKSVARRETYENHIMMTKEFMLIKATPSFENYFGQPGSDLNNNDPFEIFPPEMAFPLS